jgi:hypothetical protein
MPATLETRLISEELESRIESTTGRSVPSIDDTAAFQTFLDTLKTDHAGLFNEVAMGIEEHIDVQNLSSKTLPA